MLSDRKIGLERWIRAVAEAGQSTKGKAWWGAMFKVCDILFNLSTSYTSWDKAIGLIAAGRIAAASIITHREPLENWEQVFDDIENLRRLKGIFIP